MAKPKLLLIDDDREVLALNQKYFERAGFSVAICASADEALSLLATVTPDCIISDIMMPGTDGLTAFPEIRKQTNAPFIFLSGKSDADSRVTGLLSGADDYVVKPYSLKELEARIHIQLRNREKEQAADGISYPPLFFHLSAHKCYCGKEEIALSNREFDFFLYLARRPRKTVTFEAIGKELYQVYQESDRRTLMVIASRLRKKLERYGYLSNCLETVYGKGYRFIPPDGSV